jgi:hypothetical protein
LAQTLENQATFEVLEPVTVKLGRAQEADASVCPQYQFVLADSEGFPLNLPE